MDIEKEKQREAAYWRERYNILNQASENFSRQTYKEVEQAFNLAQKDIQRDIDAWMNRFADNNGITLVEAKKLLNAGQLKEFKWDVNEYIKRGKENAISGRWEKELENASARLHISRLEALQIQVQNHLETAFAVENKAVDKLIKDVYKNSYYHTAFEIQKGAGIGFDIAGIDEKKLDMIAKKPWTVDRRTFSDRIWERKDQMVNMLHQEMIRNCIYGRSRKEMTAALEQYVRKDIKNAKYCAARVVKTETCFYGSLSQKNALDELGCDKYQIDMPIGKGSCEICRQMNGQVFKTSEFEVGSTAPPFHPNCENASILPYYDDDFGMDGEPIDEGLSYEDWEKKYVRKDEPDNGQQMAVVSNDWSGADPIKHTKEELEELNRYAEERGIDLYHRQDFDGDISLLKAEIDTIQKIRTDFNLTSPSDKLQLGWKGMHLNEFGETTANHQEIWINQLALRNRQITEKNLTADNWLAANTAEGIAAHEMGHVISGKLKKGKTGLDIYKETVYNLDRKQISDIEAKDLLFDKVSEYSVDEKVKHSGEVKYDEIISEILSMHYTKPNKYSTEFVRLLKKYMKGGVGND